MALFIITTFLLGNQRCLSDLISNTGLRYKQPVSSFLPRSQDRQATMSLLKEHARHPLGVVSYLKRDHQIALIEIDVPDQFGGTEYKKMGLLFYASRPLKDCAGIHLSHQGVVLSYVDGSREPLISSCIEVDGQWLDGFSKERKVEPLFDKDGRSRLQATCTTDFRLFKFSDYGIASRYDTNGFVFLEASQDKKRFETLHHAGFMVTKQMPASTSELAQLVRHLSTNTVQDTDMICSAVVYGNSLQPKNALGHAAYCYVGHSGRYRLMPLNHNPSAGYRPYYGGYR